MVEVRRRTALVFWDSLTTATLGMIVEDHGTYRIFVTPKGEKIKFDMSTAAGTRDFINNEHMELFTQELEAIKSGVYYDKIIPRPATPGERNARILGKNDYRGVSPGQKGLDEAIKRRKEDEEKKYQKK